jgi:AhpC/TSA family
MGRRTVLGLFLICLALMSVALPSNGTASGRYNSLEPTSHPKTKGVPPVPGAMAPNLAMTDTAGQTFSLSSLRGKPVILEWTNYECPYVARHYTSGNMQNVQRQALAAGAIWITIFSSAPGKQGYLDARGADYFTAQKEATPSRKVLDPSGNVGRAFGARTTPHMFVIDARGVIAYAGAIDDQPRAVVADGTAARNYVVEALSAIGRGQTPAVRATAAYGCSIKY